MDANGSATIELPAWFEALNRDFRYQLTPIGGPGPNLYISSRVNGNTFSIAGGTPGLEVSWQLTGVRHDAFAEKHRIPVELEKKGDEKGKYLHPVELGLPESMGITYKLLEDIENRDRAATKSSKKAGISRTPR